jgi:hypothetical protein
MGQLSYIYIFCETRPERSVEVFKGRNLDPLLPTDRYRHARETS